MFTQCPTCQTLFRVTASQLRAAAGRVRCCRCDAIFDAAAHRQSHDDQTATQQELPLGFPGVGTTKPARQTTEARERDT
ncbi:MAG: hypothetical protein B0D96_12020, partial [Candidatus Sedimenticola endophacoides]